MIVAAGMSVSAGCGASAEVVTVAPDSFEQGIKTQDVQLVDVRTPEEYAERHLEGSINIDIKEEGFLKEAKKSLIKEKPVYVYCRSGRRSLTAAEILSRAGYKVTNLDGGILGWENEGLPVVVDRQ